MKKIYIPIISLFSISLECLDLASTATSNRPAFWDVDNLLLENFANFTLEDGSAILLEE